MFYKPSYCCNCGDRIERTESLPWSGGRFCDVCKKELSFYELMPKVFILICGIFGLLGIGSYLISGKTENVVSIKQNKIPAAEKIVSSANPVQNTNRQTVQQTELKVETDLNLNANKNAAAKRKVETVPIENEKVYFCGAMTKKGTPCSRKVKGGGRCWQHKGQEAMLPQEKLLITQ